MILFILILFWSIIGFIVFETLCSNKVRNQAKQLAKSLFKDGNCTRIRVKGHFITLKGRKIPLEGKIYLNPATKKYIFYADLTYGLFYAEKWLFTHDRRDIYLLSIFRKTLSRPFQTDFLPYLLTLKKEGEQAISFKNDREEGGIIQWRELENEIIPRWITHSYANLGTVNLEITFFTNEDTFLWW
jgi:hypothetical protein